MPSPERPAVPISLFYSYSHKDEALRDELETHLTLLRRHGVVRGWHDRRIPAGTEWAGQIDQHLEAADVILLLVSADFLASDYCYDKEMKRALERHGAGAARVIPVILRPCDWQSAPFWKLQALPKDGKPVATWKDRDEAFTDIARGIREAVASLAAGAPDHSAPAPPAEVVTPPPTARPRAVDRAALVRTVSGLSPGDMALLVTLVDGAASHVSRHGTVREQASELIGWAESSTGPGLVAVQEALGEFSVSPPRGGQGAAAGLIPFVMPFPRNPDFVGRTADLESLHAALQTREHVGIRPAGLTGMGGIGKTQLAVEYVYRHRGDYPAGIFWVNAAEPLARGLAHIGARLRPEVRGEPPDRQLQVAFEELARRPDALLVFDNLDEPAQLALPVGSEPSPLTLYCRILFTTRQRELGCFHAVEVSVLPEEAALQLLLRHPSRHAVRDDPHHPERPEAQAICRLLGWLPLALELAGAFLGKRSAVPLTDYQRRLQAEGCLSTLDSEVKHLPRILLPQVHEAAVAATLKTQWDVLTQDHDEETQLLFRMAGQFPEAAVIPTRTLGLFAGVSHAAPPGHVSPLERALDRLYDVRLVEQPFEGGLTIS